MPACVIGRMARCGGWGSIEDMEAAVIAGAVATARDEQGNGADLGTVRSSLDTRSDRRAADIATARGRWSASGSTWGQFAGRHLPDLCITMAMFEFAAVEARRDHYPRSRSRPENGNRASRAAKGRPDFEKICIRFDDRSGNLGKLLC